MINEKLNNLYYSNESFFIFCNLIGSPITRDKFFSKLMNNYLVPNSLNKEIELRIKELKEKSITNNIVFYDDSVARLNNWQYDGKFLHLEFSKTTYFEFAALNGGINKHVTELNKNISLKEYLAEDPHDLRASRLPNPLGVNISVILDSESKLAFSKRAYANFESPNVLSSVIGGTMSIGKGDLDSSGNPDPFKTVIREAHEEMGVELNEQDIAFFGIGRNLLNLKPELYGEVRLNITEKDLRELWLNSSDSSEINELLFVDLNVKSVIEIIENHKWSPSGRTATLASMIHALLVQ
jgi:hypothetical protein